MNKNFNSFPLKIVYILIYFISKKTPCPLVKIIFVLCHTSKEADISSDCELFFEQLFEILNSFLSDCLKRKLIAKYYSLMYIKNKKITQLILQPHRVLHIMVFRLQTFRLRRWSALTVQLYKIVLIHCMRIKVSKQSE